MDGAELARKLLDVRHFNTSIDDDIKRMEEQVTMLETIVIDCGDTFHHGLRMRVFFNLSDEQRVMLNDPYAEWVNYPQGILYYPSSGEWWEDDSLHLRYYSTLEEEDHHKHKVMLDVMYQIFWLAYDLSDDLKRGAEKPAATYLEQRIFVDKPEIWTFFPRIMRWWHKAKFPNWHPIDLFEDTIAKIHANYSDSGGHVYLLEGADGWFKVGRSKDAKQRVQKLGVVLPFPIETQHIIATDDMYRLEKGLHEIFAHKRGRGSGLH